VAVRALPVAGGGWDARRRRQALLAYAFLAPSLIIFLVFRHGPALASFVLGFFEWSLVDRPRFVGGANYAALWNDTVFWRALGNTALYTVMVVPVDIALALLTAVALNRKLRGISLFRLAYFVPVVTATAIVAIVWKWLYLPNGLINGALASVGLAGTNWLSSPTWALPAVAVMAVWKHFGFNMLILLAGLQNIPAELEEAARIDGATRWAVFWRITLPLLRPVLVLSTILTTIGSFQVFDAAYVMTGGGPFYATTTLVYYVYQHAFDRYQMGYAAAVAFVLFLIILAASIVQRRVMKGDEDVY
jgi:multiple sugar transport system permease protein